MVIDPSDVGNLDTRTRLLLSAHTVIEESGSAAATVDAVARAAGVSRATAYRHFSDRNAMMVGAAMLRVDQILAACTDIAAAQHTPTAKLEESIVYTATTVPADPVLAEMARGIGSQYLDRSEILAACLEFAASTLRAGQTDGEFRDDLSLEEIIRWLIDEIFIMSTWSDHSEAKVRRRVRTFVLRALEPVAHTHLTAELGRVRSALDRLDDSVATLMRTTEQPGD